MDNSVVIMGSVGGLVEVEESIGWINGDEKIKRKEKYSFISREVNLFSNPKLSNFVAATP